MIRTGKLFELMEELTKRVLSHWAWEDFKYSGRLSAKNTWDIYFPFWYLRIYFPILEVYLYFPFVPDTKYSFLFLLLKSA